MLCVSIILATYNSKENFLKTYKSICRQSYPCIEIVVVDGASTDGTREVIEQCALENKNLKWISEKDSGIYNAMNKGLHLSHGDVIVFFNDEFLVETAVEQYMKAIQESGAQGVHSDLVYRDEKGNIIRRWKMGEGDIRKGWLPGHPTLYLTLQRTFFLILHTFLI